MENYELLSITLEIRELRKKIVQLEKKTDKLIPKIRDQIPNDQFYGIYIGTSNEEILQDVYPSKNMAQKISLQLKEQYGNSYFDSDDEVSSVDVTYKIRSYPNVSIPDVDVCEFAIHNAQKKTAIILLGIAKFRKNLGGKDTITMISKKIMKKIYF
jgi:hypothetical protein